MTLKQWRRRTEKLEVAASLSQSESEVADMEWWDGEKKPPEPNGNDNSDVPAFNSETVYAPRKTNETIEWIS